MNDSGIQHRPTFATPSGFGFDDAGERVPVVLPAVEEDESPPAHRDAVEAFARLIASLLRSKDRNRAVEVLAFLFRLGSAAQDFDELGERLGVTGRQARNIVNDISKDNPDLSKLFTGKRDGVSQTGY
jgi:hypothetical protein